MARAIGLVPLDQSGEFLVPRVRIEWVPVQTFGLGLLGLDHLQLVYQPDGLIDQRDWYVIEGTRDINAGSPVAVLGVEGADGVTTLGGANPVEDPTVPGGIRYPTADELIASIGTPQTRGSLALPFVEPFNAWQLMASYAAEINSQSIPYVGAGIPLTGVATVNSTSVIASLLYYAGLDLTNYFGIA